MKGNPQTIMWEKGASKEWCPGSQGKQVFQKGGSDKLNQIVFIWQIKKEEYL